MFDAIHRLFVALAAAFGAAFGIDREPSVVRIRYDD